MAATDSRSDVRTSTISDLGAKRRWRAEHAGRALEAHRTSGLSLAAFARRSRLPLSRLRWWRKRLRASCSPAPPATVRFLPLRVRRSESVCGIIEVHLAGGRRVLVREPFDDSLLARVVRVLESVGC